MAKVNTPLYSLNSGEVDPKIIHRADLEKLKFAAETMENWIPETMGPMSLRPGLRYVGGTLNNQPAKLIPFIFNSSTTALLELTSGKMRVLSNGLPLSIPNTPAPVESAWVGSTTTPGTTPVVISGSAVSMRKHKYTTTTATKTVTVTAGSTYSCRIVVDRGPILFRVGAVSGAEDVLSTQSLDTGSHIISFVALPGVSTVFVQISLSVDFETTRSISSFSFIRNEEIVLDTPWLAADLQNIRIAQSASVIFVACAGRKQMKIERRGNFSWGVVEYKTDSGPYLPFNLEKIGLRSSGRVGAVTLTAEKPLFKSSHVGAIFEFSHSGQWVTETLTGTDQYTRPVRISGVGTEMRQFQLTISGNYSGNIHVERSPGTPDSWTPIEQRGSGDTFNNANWDDTTRPDYGTTFNNNQIIYYRLAVRPLRNDFSTNNFSGQASITIRYDGGQTVGLARIRSVTSATSAEADVLAPFGSTSFTDDWRRGAWSDAQSWPSSVALHDGRLWWAGLDKVYGTVSDDFTNFDPYYEGDAGPIVRSVATGPVEGLTWILSLQRLLVGSASAEVSIRASSFDQPLTPTEFTARNASTYGCANLPAVQLDSGGIFVQRNLKKVFFLGYNVEVNDYASSELTRVNQSICAPGVASLAIQRQPDTRVWFVKTDGAASGLVYDRNDAVSAWFRMSTDGLLKDVCVLPAANEDNVFFVVQRGNTYSIERLATTNDTGNWNMDAGIAWTGQLVPHLAGKAIIGWANGKPVTGSVSETGAVTLPPGVTSANIGLPYTARFKSVKLAYGAQMGTALVQRKRVDHLGFILFNTALGGIRFGRDFTNMTSVSSMVNGKPVAPETVLEDYDVDATTFNGSWSTDSRVCITAAAPYPATVSALVIGMSTHERA